jgi:transposase-like protein
LFLKKPTADDLTTTWSDEKRLEAVATYIALGSMAETSRVVSIPLATLWSWKQRKSWWEDMEKQLRLERNNVTATKLGSIVENTLTAITDRVANGDTVYDQRSGEFHRIPVTAASLNKIASTLLDRRILLDKMSITKQEDEVDSTQKLEKQLSKLAGAFSDFVSSRQKEEKVIESTPIPQP